MVCGCGVMWWVVLCVLFPMLPLSFSDIRGGERERTGLDRFSGLAGLYGW